MMTSLYSTRVRAPAYVSAPIVADDVVTLNPPGRDTTDETRRVDTNANTFTPTGILRPKKYINISTFNVRTLSSDTKVNELIANAEAHNVDIISVQEHRNYHDNLDINYKDVGNWTLVTSSATKNSINATIGGVGFLLSPKAKASLNYVTKISSRITIASFNSNPQLTVISCYSPTNCAPDDEVESFYDDLSDTLSQIPKHNFLMVCGDFNAQLGGSPHKFSYHSQNNRNGAYLESTMTQFKLAATNLKFQKRKGKRWTITYGNGSKGQIDYILVNRKWYNSIMNAEAYNSFESINSDHRIVTARIRLSVRANKRKVRSSTYQWETLRTDDNIQTRFGVSVRNRYQALCNEVDLDAPGINSKLYDNMASACKGAAEEIIPKRSKMRSQLPWEDSEIVHCREKIKVMSATKRRTNDPQDKASLAEAITDLDSLYLQKKADYVNRKCKEIEAAHVERKSRLVWKTVNEVTKRKKKDTGRLKASSPEERIACWQNHFASLLGNNAQTQSSSQGIHTIISEELPISTDNFTLEELRPCLKSLKNNKASGLDGIPAEVWKTRVLDNELLDYCNRTLNGDRPAQWGLSGIIPVPKKGNLSDPNNYRGISLTSVAAKVYNKLILNRLRPYVDPILRRNQNGFRQGRGTLSHILTIRRIIEGVKSKNLKSVLTFVDFKKAFDSVDRNKLIHILRAYGIPEKLVSAISIMYADTMAKVVSPDGETEFFEILAGVLQGDTLAPFLFIIVIDYVMRTALEGHTNPGLPLKLDRSSRLPRKVNQSSQCAKHIMDTEYADDLCLISETLAQAQEFLKWVEEAAAEVGLSINENKTEYMCFNQTGNKLTSMSDKELNIVSDFVYLGSWINTTERDLSIRIAKSWSASIKLDKIWKSDLSRKLKIQFFKATVESVLLYGAECWTLTKQLEKKLDGTYTRLLRASLNISWRQRLTNKSLYGDLPKVSQLVRERRLRFAGHFYRAKDECISDVLFWRPQQGKRSVGRPAKTYVDLLEEDTDFNTEELMNLMADRVLWRDVVRDRTKLPT